MDDIKVLQKYFPDLTAKQLQQFESLATTCKEWNENINVISRKDIDNLFTNHILHSLAIAKLIQFQPGSTIIDLGTGGGFPGIPLAVLFPEVKFHLVDRIGKKLKVAEEISRACNLENVSFQHGDFGECKLQADFVVSRAVMPQDELVRLVRKNIKRDSSNALPNGLISLKGGNLDAELDKVKLPTEMIDINSFFYEPFFETKKIVYTQI